MVRLRWLIVILKHTYDASQVITCANGKNNFCGPNYDITTLSMTPQEVHHFVCIEGIDQLLFKRDLCLTQLKEYLQKAQLKMN